MGCLQEPALEYCAAAVATRMADWNLVLCSCAYHIVSNHPLTNRRLSAPACLFACQDVLVTCMPLLKHVHTRKRLLSLLARLACLLGGHVSVHVINQPTSTFKKWSLCCACSLQRFACHGCSDVVRNKQDFKTESNCWLQKQNILMHNNSSNHDPFQLMMS